VYERDFVGEFGQVQCLFYRGIASADGDNLFIPEERCIAGAAVTDSCASAAEFLFAGDAKLALITAGRQDNSSCNVLFPVAVNCDIAVLEFFQLCSFAAGFYLGAEIDSLFLHLLNQARAIDVFNAGVVLYFVRVGDLPAGQEFLKHQSFEPVA
jgi:hypothetical protein